MHLKNVNTSISIVTLFQKAIWRNKKKKAQKRLSRNELKCIFKNRVTKGIVFSNMCKRTGPTPSTPTT